MFFVFIFCSGWIVETQVFGSFPIPSENSAGRCKKSSSSDFMLVPLCWVSDFRSVYVFGRRILIVIPIRDRMGKVITTLAPRLPLKNAGTAWPIRI